jgi:biopolymer transport protein ExbD
VTKETLTAAIHERLQKKGDENVLVVVRADEDAPYSVIRELLDDARAAGATRIAIATRQKTGPAR